MKAVYRVTELREGTYAGTEKPAHKVGDYMRVYCGRDEGHNFYIKDVRYNNVIRQFEYLYEGHDWYGEKSLVCAGSRKGWHYDSQGYCDNPGRGY
jgi:hypothetical protein